MNALLAALGDGCRRYAVLYADAWRTGRPVLSPPRPGRLIVLLIGFPAFLFVQVIHAVGLLLDECLWPEFHEVAVDAPIVVTGVPRSGTTFVHRALALDRERFTTFETWEAVLAPSIAERRMWRALARLDRACGRPASRLLEAAMRRWAGGFSDTVHEVALDEPEEDYLALLPVAACFLLVLCFPSSPRVWGLADPDRNLPAAERDRLLGFYRGCLERHLHEAGPGRRLLSKNAAFAGWLPALRRVLPGTRLILCVREPVGAFRSQWSSIEPGLRLCGTLADGPEIALRFLDLLDASYRRLGEWARTAGPDDTALIVDTDLRAEPAAVIAEALTRLGAPPTASHREALTALDARSRGGRSRHCHRPPPLEYSDDEIRARLGPSHAALLEPSVRLRCPAPNPARAS